MKEEEAKEAKEGVGARRDIILDIIILEFAGRARWEGAGGPPSRRKRLFRSHGRLETRGADAFVFFLFHEKKRAGTALGAGNGRRGPGGGGAPHPPQVPALASPFWL